MLVLVLTAALKPVSAHCPDEETEGLGLGSGEEQGFHLRACSLPPSCPEAGSRCEVRIHRQCCPSTETRGWT